jgi:hypothetical protein
MCSCSSASDDENVDNNQSDNIDDELETFSDLEQKKAKKASAQRQAKRAPAKQIFQPTCGDWRAANQNQPR